MGNVCCTGRSHPSPQESDDLSRKISNPPSTSGRSRPQESEKGSTSTKTTPKTLQSLEIAQLNPTDSNPLQSLPEKPLSVDSEVDYAERANTVNFLSNRTEARETLEYSLLMPEDLSKLQQTQILSVLDNYKSNLSAGDQEEVDGFVYVEESKKQHMMMISTHAVYLLKPEDISKVEKRVQLENIPLLVISKTKDTILFVVKNSSEDFVVCCENFENLLKSLQQVSFEAFGQYIPWITAQNAVETFALLRKVNVNTTDLLNDEHLAIVKAIVEHGCIGETKLLVESCRNCGESKLMNVYFVMTDQAIYTLDSSYGFKHRIDLRSIEKLSINQKSGYLVIYESLGIHEYSLPLTISKSIQESARKLGKNIQIIED